VGAVSGEVERQLELLPEMTVATADGDTIERLESRRHVHTVRDEDPEAEAPPGR